MALRLSLLCHAATAATRASAFPADEPVEPAALRRLAERPRPSAEHVWASPALRARQTAEALRLDARVEPQLADCDYGRWAGRSFDALRGEEPEAIAQWLADPAAAPHGGDTLLGLIARVGEWLDGLDATGSALAVTHAAVARAAIIHAIDAGPESFWRIDVAPLTLVRLSGAQGRWNLVGLSPLAADAP